MAVSKIPDWKDLRKLEANHRRQQVIEGWYVALALLGLPFVIFLVAKFSPFSSEFGNPSLDGWIGIGVAYLTLAGCLARQWTKSERDRELIRAKFREEVEAYGIREAPISPNQTMKK